MNESCVCVGLVCGVRGVRACVCGSGWEAGWWCGGGEGEEDVVPVVCAVCVRGVRARGVFLIATLQTLADNDNDNDHSFTQLSVHTLRIALKGRSATFPVGQKLTPCRNNSAVQEQRLQAQEHQATFSTLYQTAVSSHLTRRFFGVSTELNISFNFSVHAGLAGSFASAGYC